METAAGNLAERIHLCHVQAAQRLALAVVEHLCEIHRAVGERVVVLRAQAVMEEENVHRNTREHQRHHQHRDAEAVKHDVQVHERQNRRHNHHDPRRVVQYLFRRAVVFAYRFLQKTIHLRKSSSNHINSRNSPAVRSPTITPPMTSTCV